MKHITYAGKSLLVGDDAADTMTEYAAILANAGAADTVTLKGYDAHGEDVEATFILNSGTVLMTETTHSSIPEPDNRAAVQYMRDEIGAILTPRYGSADLQELPGYFDEF